MVLVGWIVGWLAGWLVCVWNHTINERYIFRTKSLIKSIFFVTKLLKISFLMDGDRGSMFASDSIRFDWTLIANNKNRIILDFMGTVPRSIASFTEWLGERNTYTFHYNLKWKASNMVLWWCGKDEQVNKQCEGKLNYHQ